MSLKKVLIKATEKYGEDGTNKYPSRYQQLPEFNGKRLPDWVCDLIKEAYEKGKDDGKNNERRYLKKKFDANIGFDEKGAWRERILREKIFG